MEILAHEVSKGNKDWTGNWATGNLDHILAKGLAVFTHVLRISVELNFRAFN